MASDRICDSRQKLGNKLHLTSPGVLCHIVSIFIIRMKFHKSKMLMTVAAAALALAVGACSSSSDDDDELSMLLTDLDAATAKAAGLQDDLDEANASSDDSPG